MSIVIEFDAWAGFWTFSSKNVKGICFGWVMICFFNVSVIGFWDKAIMQLKDGE